MIQRTYSKTIPAIFAGWSVFSVLTLTLVLLLRDLEVYYAKAETALPALAVILIWAVAASLIFLFGRRKTGIASRRPIYLLSIGLFAAQAWLFYNIYFLTNWDTVYIINAAQSIAFNGSLDIASSYLSRYPNNLLLTWLYTLLFPTGEFFGIQWAYFVILFQCALSVFGGLMLFSLADQLVSLPGAYLSWIVYALHIALNPWLGILYSDPMALCVPIGIIYLYHCIQDGRRLVLKWCSIGLLACIGYLLKPFSAIAAIAVLLVDVIRTVSCREKQALRRAFAAYACAILASAAFLGVFNGAIVPSMGLKLDHEARLGAPHFLMMGLNTDSNGAWNHGDVLFSSAQPNRAARDEANLRAAAGRLRDMGVSGLMEHSKKKLLVNFADGTYAWGKEGDFYFQLLPQPNEFAAPFLRSLFYNHGENYRYWESLQNFIWYTILLGSSLSAAAAVRRKEQSSVAAALFLSLLGIAAYVMLFEARARYLFIYAPLLLLAAVYGLKGSAPAVPKNRRL